MAAPTSAYDSPATATEACIAVAPNPDVTAAASAPDEAELALPPDSIPDVIRLWLMRTLVPLGAYAKFVCSWGFSESTLAEELGLKEVNDKDDCFDMRRTRDALREEYRRVEAGCDHAQVPVVLQENVRRLGALVGLSEVDCRILEFVLLIYRYRRFEDIFDHLGRLTTERTLLVLSRLLKLPLDDVAASLARDGMLERSGLVRIDRRNTYSLHLKIDILSEELPSLMMAGVIEPEQILNDRVRRCPASGLSLDDYQHVAREVEIAGLFLRRAMETGKRGSNILIHGAPGTGKTELARLLALGAGQELYEVANATADGRMVEGVGRLRAFGLAQRFFESKGIALVFDEAEDVFGRSTDDDPSAADLHKAWVNQLLESNTVPTIWVSNSVGGIDRAFIRRFDMVLELPVPPQQVRLRLIQESLPGRIDEQAARSIAASDKLSPAVIARAADVVRILGDTVPDADVATTFRFLVDQTLRAQRWDPLPSGQLDAAFGYDPSFLNADLNLEQVAAGIARVGSARICLYGPPGTGKTGFGRWLAERLGVPLHVISASDLLSSMVGETEERIRAAFEHAAKTGSVLLFDEVDSYLRDRREAQRSWETTQVNEFLTRLESFAGVVVASTNLMNDIDPAALRRFDLKLEFRALRPEQAQALLGRTAESLGLSMPTPEDQLAIAHVQGLAPGDFAACARRHRFHPFNSPAELIGGLRAECRLKQAPSNAIGFH